MQGRLHFVRGAVGLMIVAGLFIACGGDGAKGVGGMIADAGRAMLDAGMALTDAGDAWLPDAAAQPEPAACGCETRHQLIARGDITWSQDDRAMIAESDVINVDGLRQVTVHVLGCSTINLRPLYRAAPDLPFTVVPNVSLRHPVEYGTGGYVRDVTVYGPEMKLSAAVSLDTSGASAGEVCGQYAVLALEEAQ